MSTADDLRSARRHRFVVEAGDAGLRLDQLLAKHVPGLSRGAARTLLAIGGVFVDRSRVRIASRIPPPGAVVEAWIGGALDRARGGRRASPPEPRVVFVDDHVVVVDKPAGILSAPTPEGDRGSLADVLRRGALAGSSPAVVHRLDLMTSGLVVLALTDLANRELSARFRVHDVEREYLAVVAGRPAQDSFAVDAPIDGRRAMTFVRCERPLGPGATLVRARLETGRTHQIRIHLAGLGHPVLGDRAHAARAAMDPPRMALHATLLGFAHPADGRLLRFESPWPKDLAPWLAALESDPDRGG